MQAASRIATPQAVAATPPAGRRRVGLAHVPRCASAACVGGTQPHRPSPAERHAPKAGVASWGLGAARARLVGRQVVARAKDEDWEPNFAEVDSDSVAAPGGVAERAFGPEAMLLINFAEDEVLGVRAMMDGMGADFIEVVPCTKAMLGTSLGEALVAEGAEWEQLPGSVPRVLILSGMSSAEVIQTLDAFEEDGFAPAVYAACVPRNIDTNVLELAEEVRDDHVHVQQEMAKRQAAGGVDSEEALGEVIYDKE